MKDKKTTPPVTTPEKPEDLKKETVKDDSVKMGYNEKNPIQPQGAFKPDSNQKLS